MRQGKPQGLRLTSTTRAIERLLAAAFVYVFLCGAALAQSYSAGYAKYQKGDFNGAETSLKQALGGKLPRTEQAKVYKLLGICQFMLGNKAAAGGSFKRALALQPGITVGANEVLDESVIPFFNAQKGGGAPKASAGKKPAPKAAAGAPAAAPPPPNQPIAGPKVVKSTFLKVVSNVAAATISIDGILAGQANSLINTDPGPIMIEVTASGYLAKKVKVNVIKNRENTVTVNLDKPKPKPKPKPKAKPKPKPKDGGGAFGGQGALVAAKGDAKKKKRKKQGGGAMYAPAPDDGMFYDDKGGGGGGGPPPAGPDAAAEFDMDAATGGAYAGAPQGGYGAPPGYAAPPAYAPPAYAPPPPMYYAPPPVYYTPPPPPPPPPPPDPGYNTYASGGGYGEPPPPDPAGPGAAPGDSASDGGAGGGKSTLITLLPFGAGQFQNKRYILGLAFAGAEVGALFYWYSSNKLADDTVAETNTYIQQKKGPNGDQQLSQEDLAFVAQRKKFVDDQRKKAQLGIAGFLGVWAIGIVQATLDDPPPKKKSRKRRKYTGFSYVPDGEGKAHYHLLDELDERHHASTFDWGLAVSPETFSAFTPEPEPARRDFGVGVQLDWSF